MENLAKVCEEKMKDQNAKIKALCQRIPVVDLDSSSQVTTFLTFLSKEIQNLSSYCIYISWYTHILLHLSNLD